MASLGKFYVRPGASSGCRGALVTLRELSRGASRRTLRSVTPIKSFSTRVEADLARIALQAAGIEATVVGIGVAMEGGADGVRLLVRDDQVEAALEVLRDG